MNEKQRYDLSQYIEVECGKIHTPTIKKQHYDLSKYIEGAASGQALFLSCIMSL